MITIGFHQEDDESGQKEIGLAVPLLLPVWVGC